MVDISIVEFGVYGFIAYSSLLMLIISTIKEVPSTKSFAIARVVYLVPGMICAAFLAGVGVNIDLETSTNTIMTNQTINEFTINGTTGDLITNSTTTTSTNSTSVESNYIILQNPVWALFHYIIFIVLAIYVITQLLNLFTKTD